MIPKFRAWDETENLMSDVREISIFDKYVELENGAFRGFDEVVLMQSTGLHDKNGMEIFEGDIVKFSAEHDGLSKPPRNIKYEIAIEDLVALIKNMENKLVLRMVNQEMEIIGNIHEHRELLQEERR
ncbi:hypothetical protein P1M60_002007 [Staphylococcus pseudintermedius]|nr:hypothetical protein [Staphylococcus pseudintermedius]